MPKKADALEHIGVPTIDVLGSRTEPSVTDYIAAVSAYVILRDQLSASARKAAQIRMSKALGRCLLTKLRDRMPEMLVGAMAGETKLAGALRTVQADVSEMHPLDGLRMAIEVKPVNLAVGRAIWNRFGDIRTFAVNLHLKFPFAVVGGVMPVPVFELRSGEKKSTLHLIDRAVERFVRAGGRRTEGDAPHLLEGITVIAYNPEDATVHEETPPRGSRLRLEEFIEDLARAYEARFEK